MWCLIFCINLCLPLKTDSRWCGRSIFAGFLLLFFCSTSAAGIEPGVPIAVSSDVPGYLARIEQDNPGEVEQALLKAERYYIDNGMSTSLPVIAFVLHGPEVEIFFRENYSRYKPIVDLAARLSALKVVDIKVCRTRLRFLETDVDQLFPFVGSVPFGPAEIERLTGEAEYVYF